ncbi:MAG TPA: hypothetical protein VFN67_04925 [Polyangiales bacterium]|nr:hypothetical protein [Polyangiales bacterium]
MIVRGTCPEVAIVTIEMATQAPRCELVRIAAISFNIFRCDPETLK